MTQSDEEITVETRHTVRIERAVRFNRLLIVGAVIGGVFAAMITAMLPIAPGAQYTLGQAVMFFAVIGAAFGALGGGILGLMLNQIAKRRKGTGVAVHTDVR